MSMSVNMKTHFLPPGLKRKVFCFEDSWNINQPAGDLASVMCDPFLFFNEITLKKGRYHTYICTKDCYIVLPRYDTSDFMFAWSFDRLWLQLFPASLAIFGPLWNNFVQNKPCLWKFDWSVHFHCFWPPSECTRQVKLRGECGIPFILGFSQESRVQVSCSDCLQVLNLECCDGALVSDSDESAQALTLKNWKNNPLFCHCQVSNLGLLPCRLQVPNLGLWIYIPAL